MLDKNNRAVLIDLDSFVPFGLILSKPGTQGWTDLTPEVRLFMNNPKLISSKEILDARSARSPQKHDVFALERLKTWINERESEI